MMHGNELKMNKTYLPMMYTMKAKMLKTMHK